jgi:ectoine hydroxylase-related dioxygenase (phytanoyl-CoA dioxygenase family)
MSKPDHIEAFQTQGYAVLRRVFDAAEVAAIAAAFDRIWAEALAKGRSWRDRNLFYNVAHDDAFGPIVRYTQWPSWVNPTLEAVRRDPRIRDMLAPLIGDDLKQIINQLHWKPPGAAMAEFGFHQDSRSRRPREAYRDLAGSYIQTGIAVDPHRSENGAMVVCPGSHKLGELPFDPSIRSMEVAMDTADLEKMGVNPTHTVVLEMEPGDVALWHVHTLHGSGPNVSAIDRRFYINGYVTAANCDRGEWAFRNGAPCPLSGEPALVHYEGLRENPGPMFVD